MDQTASLRELSRDERLLLLKVVCSFVWVDLVVQPQERDLVEKLVRRLKLDADETRQVMAWLESPQAAGAVDPESVPEAHRMMFLRAAESVISVDGEVTSEERESLIDFAKRLR